VDGPAATLLLDAGIAAGLGLMIGLEREQHEVEENGARESTLGVRSFALLALLGWAAGYLGLTLPWLPPVIAVVVGALVIAAYLREPTRGTTTEVAAVLTHLLGMLVSRARVLAVALAIVTALLLVSKPWFGKLVPRLRRMDITATLQMGILFAIVLPLLPEEARDPWKVLAPRRIGLFVFLILGVDYVGYVLNRTLGKSRGAGLTGLVGGLTSSTAVTASMAQEARRDPASAPAGQLGTFLANAVMTVRIVIISAVVSRRVALAVAPALGAMLACFLGAALWQWRRLRRAAQGKQAAAEVELRNPLSLVPAVKWGLFLCFVLVAAAVGKQLLGDRGVLVAAALSGLADVDAITLAAARDAESGSLGLGYAALAIVIAASMNNVIKGGIAVVTGGKRYGALVAAVFGAALVAGVGVALASML
jgi:uncharacterized membrane protein (DUF4010 family)